MIPNWQTTSAIGLSEWFVRIAKKVSVAKKVSGLLFCVKNKPDTINLVLGNDKFRQEVEHLTGQRQRHLKRGPVAGFKSIKN
jgi:hypothetical protein